jgi:hypothetical protein
VLPIVVVLIISIFAFDGLKESLRQGQLFTGTLSVALTPIIRIVLILIVWAVSWRWELIGGGLYFALAMFMSWRFGPPGSGMVSFDPLLSTPFVLIGGLVLRKWFTGNPLSATKKIMTVWVPPAVVALGLVVTGLRVFVFP